MEPFRNLIRVAALSIAACLVMAVAPAGAGNDNSPSLAAKARRPAVKAAPQKSSKKSAAPRRRHRREGARTRLARLKLQPERAAEIQRALVACGYLHQEPSGEWDDETRAAMKRFQADHGFPSTGLPEAKSLMKLGLGPHPLPDELDPTTQARAMEPPSAHPDPTPSK